ncbi:sulfatase-like hydrolase/transferase [Synoicihabitans lomoniglobus]|uniref:Sulfatase-like hydrolase/transferase n=1 Tax=Synoicihabitans lomoniglobus TaxID=2909285 RepID=A0AAF0A0A2_9BACT|nr:sulfatase-like hydrolase/transferase [Opitutaceae bacterium LMO-M01]WED64102.1 sulfatase-like hydrolase/transferase [Opitutaceae bacterium LMO-M01]
MNRFSRSRLLLILGGTIGLWTGAMAEERPNILWLVAEDMSSNLGSYGDPDANTPSLDQLATQGVRFTRAFSAAGVCAPSRSSLATGMFASSLGSQHMRGSATLSDQTPTLPQLLRDAGYYCTNNFKEDYNFPAPAGMWDESSRKAHWRNRAPGQPFFSIFNFMTTHESRLRFDDEAFAKLTAGLTPEQRHDPAKVTLPAWLPDTPEVRREWARNHDMITAMDGQVKTILAQLEADGLADDTVVMFYTDHGAGLPRAKQFNFEAGLQVPLIVCVPEKWRTRMAAEPGSVDSQLVSLIDLAPSILSFLKLPVPEMMQGRDVLSTTVPDPNDYIYSIRDRMDERIDMSRTVRSDRFKYHRNYHPDLPHFPWLDYMDLLQSSQAFRRLAVAGDLSPGLTYFMADHKALEELYDLRTDPDELHNVAHDPAYADTLARMRAEHFDWARRTVDTGFIPEQMLRDFAVGSSEFEYARSGAYDIDRCIAAVRLLEQGAAAGSVLMAALADSYPPVRYWAASGLAALGREVKTPGMGAALRKALQDEHAEVSIAAAEALCNRGEPSAALPFLTRWLEDERPLVQLAAANVMDRIDEQALPVRAAMQRVAALDPGPFSGANLFLMVQWVLQRALAELDAHAAPARTATGPLTLVGVAKVDITPPMAVRLHGFPRGVRKTSSNAVTQRIFAKAMAIGGDAGEDPVLLLTTDLLGVSDEMAAALMARLGQAVGFTNRARLTLTSAHNHSAPALKSVAPYVFRVEPSPEDAAEIAAYEAWLMDRLEQVAVEALTQRQPARLAHATGQAGFGMNRRLVENGEWVTFGDNPHGPMDQDLTVMSVRAPDGTLRATWFSYACHGVCWQAPSVHGDWMGVAQSRLEAAHPGSVAMVTVGCGGNINPLDIHFRGEDPVTPGEEAAAEVERVLGQPMEPLAGTPQVRVARFDLPLQPVPDLAHWEKRKDWFSRTMTARLQRGEPVATSIPYMVQTWTFADELNIVFLAGEVHVQYGLRLKKEFPGGRLWVNAYAHDSPAYIPAADEIPEGGWEVDGSRINYGVPARFDPSVEDLIFEQVKALLSPDVGPVPRASATSPAIP